MGAFDEITPTTIRTEPSVEKEVVSSDDHLLMQLGYKPELRRNFSVIQVFGIAFSIMSLLPSIASVLAINLPAGGCATWSWLVASCCILSVGICKYSFCSFFFLSFH